MRRMTITCGDETNVNGYPTPDQMSVKKYIQTQSLEWHIRGVVHFIGKYSWGTLPKGTFGLTLETVLMVLVIITMYNPT